ncbi:MAG TPA: DOMON-like domain-containing protein [Anaerolineales bacterium]|nr:DOMON-like domain-containing protein [Anaerolineales bacterium]
MPDQSFSLIPFPARLIPAITISGWVTMLESWLTVRYVLAGDLHMVFLPAESASPRRKDELWKQTCFEFFLALKGRPQYWEFNFSPAGDWNVYRMEAYRRIDFQEEASIQSVRRKIHRATEAFSLQAAVDLRSMLQYEEPLEMGVTAVVHMKDGNETYWALTHPGPQADFHNRESFTLVPVRQSHPSKQSDPVD